MSVAYDKLQCLAENVTVPHNSHLKGFFPKIKLPHEAKLTASSLVAAPQVIGHILYGREDN